MTNPGQTTNADQGSIPGMMPEDPQQRQADANRIQDTDQVGYNAQGSSMGTDAASGQPGGMDAATTGQATGGMDAPMGTVRGTATPPPPGGSNTTFGNAGALDTTAPGGAMNQGGYGGTQEYPDQSDVGSQGSVARGGVSQTDGMSQSGMDDTDQSGMMGQP